MGKEKNNTSQLVEKLIVKTLVSRYWVDILHSILKTAEFWDVEGREREGESKWGRDRERNLSRLHT